LAQEGTVDVNLTLMRANLAAALVAAEIPELMVATTWTARVNAPAILVLPAASWISNGAQPFGALKVSLDLILVGGSADREASLERLETLVSDAIEVAFAQGWGLAAVEEPSTLLVNGASMLACSISISQTARAVES
jgi:hypothetical protein